MVNVPLLVPVQLGVTPVSVITTVYSPATAGVIVAVVGVNPSGPDHAYVYEPVPVNGVAVNEPVPSDAQIASSFTETVGFALMVNVPLLVPVQFGVTPVSVITTVYSPATAGVIVAVVGVNPSGPDHAYVYEPVPVNGVAVNEPVP